MTLYKWSQTASADATADSTINWAEGQPPSSVNDSARAMMAATAKYRDDTSGSLLTGGTSTAYTVSSNQVFTSKSAMNGAEIAVTIHATNGASPTLNVDGLGADPIIIDTSSGATPVPSATLLTGGVYTLVYYNTGNSWRLKDFYQLPFTVPIGGMIDFTGSTSPSGNFVFPFGQAISRTTYSVYFGLVGTTFGTGDGSTTFNIPDLRGRVIAGKGDMGGSDAGRLTSSYFGANGTTLGAVGGSESNTLTSAQMPTHNHGVTDPGHTHGTSKSLWGTDISGSAAQGGNAFVMTGATINSATTGISIQNAGSGGAHNNTQPTIVLNKLLRII